MVKVKAFLNFRDIMDRETDLELSKGETIEGLLKVICDIYEDAHDAIFDEAGSFREYLNILKKGRNIRFLQGIKTKLEDDDLIALFPPLSGG